jgi:hypothetical protein
LKEIRKVAGPACQRPTPAHGCVFRPAQSRRRCGGLVTTHHLAPAWSAARHVCSTRNACSRRLHVSVVSLSPHSCHAWAEFPFASSPLTSPLLCRSPLLLCCCSALQVAPSAATVSRRATSARLMSRLPPAEPEHASVRKSSRHTSA